MLGRHSPPTRCSKASGRTAVDHRRFRDGSSWPPTQASLLQSDIRADCPPLRAIAALKSKTHRLRRQRSDAARRRASASVAVLKEPQVEAIGICFMHAYANAAHEEALARSWPSCGPKSICVLERRALGVPRVRALATATVNASLSRDGPLSRTFDSGVADLGIGGAPRVMQSNGGAVSPRAVRKCGEHLFLGACRRRDRQRETGRPARAPEFTRSTWAGRAPDVCLIREGEPAKKSERAMGGFPVRTQPSTSTHRAGAARSPGPMPWSVKVGPQAQALPGACRVRTRRRERDRHRCQCVLAASTRKLLGGRMTCPRTKRARDRCARAGSRRRRDAGAAA